MPESRRIIVSVMQLTRMALVFTAISNAWLVILLTDGLPDEHLPAAIAHWPLVWRLVFSAGVATGMYVFGMTLNDLLDVRRDKLFAPNRPLPSGRLTITTAIVLTVSALLVAVICAVPLGVTSTVLCLACAMLVLLYDATGKYIPPMGLVLLGLIRGMHMFIFNPHLGFGWPVWLTMTHVIILSAMCYAMERKRPRLTGMGLAGVIAGWGFWSMALMGVMAWRKGLASSVPWLWIGPTVTVGALVWMWAWRIKPMENRRLAGREWMKVGLLWLIVHDAGWLAAAGLWWQAALVGGLLLLAWLSMRLTRWMSETLEAPGQFVSDHGQGRHKAPTE
jgi:4-hydroxybenzoate polyprenyltransferase